MSGLPDGLHRVTRLETAFRPAPWHFATREAARIDAHWAQARAEKPAMFDGKVLLMRDPEIFSAPKGDVLRGGFFETDFRNFHAWLAFGAPREDQADGAFNCFSMAALRTRDGAFLLGEMGPHTMNAGKIYFAAGTPDRSDIFGEKVDLAASLAREMTEETGFSPEEAPAAPGWSVVVSGARIACIQQRRLPLTAREAVARAADFLAREKEPELLRLHAVFGPQETGQEIGQQIDQEIDQAIDQEIDTKRMPDFIQVFLRDAFAAQPCG